MIKIKIQSFIVNIVTYFGEDVRKILVSMGTYNALRQPALKRLLRRHLMLNEVSQVFL